MSEEQPRGALAAVISGSVRHPWLVALVVAASVFIGLVAYRGLSVDLFPDLTSPVVTVIVENPALAPQEAETLIARPLETAFRALPNVLHVRSDVEAGLVMVRTEFVFGTDYYLARQLLSERLSALTPTFPQGTESPVLSSAASRLAEIMQFTISGDMPPKELREAADFVVRYKLQTVPGIIRISNLGGERRAYEVLLDPVKLSGLGLTVSDILKALRESNVNFSAGFIIQDPIETSIRGVGRIRNLEDLGHVVVTTHGTTPILLTEVATVRDGETIRRGIARVGGKEAVFVTITKQLGTDTIGIAQQVRRALEELRPTLPGVVMRVCFDQAELIRTATRTLEEALLIGGAAVVLVIFFFLGNVRATLIASAVIPISVLITFALMKWYGVSLNVMSIGGLAVGLGIMIDAAIIDTENIYRHIQMHPNDRFNATVRASMEIRRPAIYSTLILIAVFAPLLTLGGMEGRVFAPLAFTVIALMAIGLVLSLTLTPALCHGFLHANPEEHRPTALTQAFSRLYDPVLQAATRRPLAALGIGLAILLVTLAAMPWIKTELLPKLDEGALELQFNTAPGIGLNETDRLASQVSELLKGGPDIDQIVQPTGRGEGSEDPMPVTRTEHLIQLVDKGKRRHSLDEVERWVRKKLENFPGASIAITTPLNMRIEESLSGVSADVAVKIFGSDLNILAARATELRESVERIPGVVDVVEEQNYGVPQATVLVNRVAAGRYGLTPQQIGDNLQALVAGVEATTVLRDQLREYPVLVRLAADYRRRPEDLGNVVLDTPGGMKVPLSQVAQVVITRGPASIRREDQLRRSQVTFNVRGRSVNAVVADVSAVLKKLNLPEGYFYALGGTYQRQQELMTQMIGIFVVSGLLVLVLLYLAFRSFLKALLVLATIPLALVGGVFALVITGISLNVSSVVGFLAHFGLSVQKGLILLEYIGQLQREGLPWREAVLKGAKTRMRPVLMTAASASLGVLPIAIGWGAGAELQQPLAVVLIGGLITSTLLTLVLLPCLYLYLSNRRQSDQTTA
jgi:cobalt-zinc-cadmium resistance protein CzcA